MFFLGKCNHFSRLFLVESNYGLIIDIFMQEILNKLSENT